MSEKNIYPRRAIVVKVSDGLGYEKNDWKYIGKAFNRVINIVHKLDNKGESMYISDFFIPEYISEKNDYIHYGFLIVSRNNIEFV